MMREIEASGTPLARYVSRFAMYDPGGDVMWDELAAAAWIDPTIIIKRESRYMSVDLDRGPSYGNTLWQNAPVPQNEKARFAGESVEVQVELDLEKFYRMFIALMKTRTPAVN